MKNKIALITGITGQDGYYLSKFLLSKDYNVYGMYRRTSTDINERLIDLKDEINLVDGDLTDTSSLVRILSKVKPNEIYNLGAQSFVPESWTQPIASADITGIGVLRMLEAIRLTNKDVKLYNAASSEMFGKVQEIPQTEKTPFYPRSPYGCAKVYAFNITRNYRESYNMFACSGILHNHESPKRNKQFVTRKVTDSAVKIKLGLQDILELGNFDAKRDWGYANDFCINLDVPILTDNGWKFHDQINDGEHVINFNTRENRMMEDNVLKKVILNSDGNKIVLEGRGVYLKVTFDHRLFYQQKSKNSKGGWSKWKEITAKNFYDLFKNKSVRSKYDYRFPHFQDYKGKEYKILDEEIYFLGVLLAEGSLEQFNKGNGVRVSVSQSYIKNKKTHDKIQDHINRLNFTSHVRRRNDGVVEWVFDSKTSKKILKLFDEFNVHIVPNYVWKFSQRQFEILFDALMDCDGCWGELSYSSSSYKLAVDFQTIAHLSGYRTSQLKKHKGLNHYLVYVITKRKKYTYIQNVKKIKEEAQKVWCVSTNNGTIITRDNDCIFISGNCEAMYLMLQQSEPDDYVIATNETHSVRELVDEAFNLVEMPIKWEGKGVNEVGKHKGKTIVKVNPEFYRPAEVDILLGDYSKAKKQLGWEPKTKFKELIKMMVESDLKLNKNEIKKC